ncbi:MAG: AAA family ATPase [Deltaproteobacteria bacterium]|nr:AAA family ATPase [Deltaproteobacteria bacterium]
MIKPETPRPGNVMNQRCPVCYYPKYRRFSEVGVAPTNHLKPQLDAGAVSVSEGAITLHDGDVPLRRAGLGTRRLLAIAMQRQAAIDGGITLIDEFEQGLEPHRIRRLLRVLRGRPPEEADEGPGQLILTTHSPTVLSELEAQEVCIIRRESGNVGVSAVPEDVGFILPRAPEALLARRVVVTEGATEHGLCDAMDEGWTKEKEASFAYRGVAVVDGEGGTVPAKIAGRLDALGFDVAILCDSDAKAKLSHAGSAKQLAWPGGVATEERLALDLPLAGLKAMVEMAARSPKASGGPRAVRDAVAAAIGLKPNSLDADRPSSWVDAVDEQNFRKKFGSIAS